MKQLNNRRTKHIDYHQNLRTAQKLCHSNNTLLIHSTTGKKQSDRNMAPMDHALSASEEELLAFLPKAPAALSALGSMYILHDVLWRHARPHRMTYHYLLAGMSLSDLLASVAWGLSTWPSPNYDDNVVYGAHGNMASCTAQGFFTQFSLATPLYNASLALYYLLVIRFGYTEGQLATCSKSCSVARLLHAVPLGLALITSIAALPLTLYNNFFGECWISKVPVDCVETWQSGYTTCERGDNATLYVWLFYYIPLWLALVIATVCMIWVWWSIRQTETKSQRWNIHTVPVPEAVVIPSAAVAPVGAGPVSSMSEDMEIQTQQQTQQKRDPQQQRRRQQRKRRRSAEVGMQGLFYIGAFYFTWLFPTITKIIQLGWNVTYFELTVMTAVTLPLQGFLNMLVYIRPRYIHSRAPTRWARLVEALIHCEAPALPRSRDGINHHQFHHRHPSHRRQSPPTWLFSSASLQDTPSSRSGLFVWQRRMSSRLLSRNRSLDVEANSSSSGDSTSNNNHLHDIDVDVDLEVQQHDGQSILSKSPSRLASSDAEGEKVEAHDNHYGVKDDDSKRIDLFELNALDGLSPPRVPSEPTQAS